MSLRAVVTSMVFSALGASACNRPSAEVQGRREAETEALIGRAEELLKGDPGSDRAVTMLEEHLRGAIPGPRTARAWLRLAEARERRGQLAEARDAYSSAAAPGADAWVRRWALLRGARLDLDPRQSRQRAQRALQQVLADGKEDAAAAWAYLSLGEEQRLPGGDPKKAAEAFEQAVRLAKDDQVTRFALFHLADVRGGEGRFEDAANIYIDQLNEPTRALQLYSTAVDAAPAGDARHWALLRLGDLQRRLRDQSGALTTFQRVAGEKPTPVLWCWATLKTGEALQAIGTDPDRGRALLVSAAERCRDPQVTSYAHVALARDDLCRRHDRRAYDARRRAIRSEPARATYEALAKGECSRATPQSKG